MHVYFRTTEFIFSHGKSPRGHGAWAFEFDDGQQFWLTPMLYSDAKRAAAKEARRRVAHLRRKPSLLMVNVLS
jgi:hypothetical protein